MIIWISGLSAAGKTTVGSALTEALRKDGKPVVFLDGDILREVWQDDLGYTLDERRINAKRISYLCRMLDRQGINVVAAVLYPFAEWIAWNRKHADQFFMTLLDVPMTTLEARDPKGLYAGARAGTIKNVVGVDLKFEQAIDSDLVLFNGEPLRTPASLAEEIVEHLPPFKGR